MQVKTFFLETDLKLSRVQKDILRRTIQRHAEIAGGVLGKRRLNFIVYPTKAFEYYIIPEIGNGGFTHTKDLIQLSVDPSRFRGYIAISFPATVYHECHHAKRMESAHWHKTLLDVVVFEGLATVFQEELWPKFIPPWGRYTPAEIRKLWKIFEPRMNDKKYYTEDWYRGTGKIPRWAAYKIGSHIVREAKKINPVTATELVDVSAKRILKMAGVV